MKVILCLLLVLISAPFSLSDHIDAVKAVQEYFLGQGSYLNLNLTSVSSCFNQTQAQDFLIANSLLTGLAETWQTGQYKMFNFLNKIIGNISIVFNPSMDCIKKLPEFDDYLMATFGTTNLQMAVAYFQAFLLIHTQDFVYLSSPIYYLMNDMDFYEAGRLQASLYQTAAYMVNKVGLYREVYGLIESGAYAAQNLSAPASTFHCYDDVEAQTAIQLLVALCAAVTGSSDDYAWENTVSWFNTNQQEINGLSSVFYCEEQDPEFNAYLVASGLNTTVGFVCLAETYINTNPQEYKNLLLNIEIELMFEAYISTGRSLNNLLTNIVGNAISL